MTIPTQPEEICRALEKAVREALPDAEVEAQGNNGHYRLAVRAKSLQNSGTLAAHRTVMRAIAPLLKGDSAPVHAIDELKIL